MADPIKIEGLAEFSKNLKVLDRDLPKALRLAFNAAADIVVTDARGRIPSRSGRAKSTVKAKSTQTASRISGGGNKAPYYPWLDFGGKVGRAKSVERPFLREGRYIYWSFYKNRSRYAELLEQGLLDVAAQSGIEVE